MIDPASLAPAVAVAARAQPERLTNIEGWHEHIPFAFALIALARPSVLVELGTHKGDSFCAFCQAVAELGAGTRCFAVDTWQGDPHAGIYGEEVLAELRRHVEPRYARFATLMPMLFDEALARFADGSIDGLHIDGLHTEEAVRHDFETWLPKMSPCGVVLFHDTRVEREGFGVRKVWQEVAARYPNFEFFHGNGLGVLLVGATPPEALLEWCRAEAGAQETLRAVFRKFGERVRIGRHLELYQSANAELWKRTQQAEATLDGAVRQLADTQKQVGELCLQVGDARTEILRLGDLVAAWEQRAARAEAELAKVLSSRAWRATAPLRRVAAWLRRVA